MRPAIAVQHNLYLPLPAKIVHNRWLTQEVKLHQIRFLNGEIAETFDYRPGQFVEVSVIGTGEAPISLTSTPSRKGIIEIAVRTVGKVTRKLNSLPIGSVIGIRGPFGNGFPLEKLYDKDLVIIAGGIGVLPLRSLILYAMDYREKFKNVYILYGSRTPSLVTFREEFEVFQTRGDLNFFMSVDRPEPGVEWTGRVCLVTGLLDEIKNKIDPKNTNAVLCGPPIMYKFVIKELIDMGFPYENIWIDTERRMECGIGKCGHCTAGDKYVCIDGPIFNYWEIIRYPELLE